MNKEEIKEYLKRVEELELKLTGEDKDTLQWLIYGYNQCAKLLNETEQENIQLKIQLLEKKCSDKDVEHKEKIKLQAKVNQLETNRDEAIEYVKNTYDDVVSSFAEDKPMTNFKARKDLLSILERGKE